ncbi:uncharacterized protein LOC127621606 isoform X5 [Xyrauchen texanus]|uniref:uncharacterized protein LOC127621606 isoform X5 n=1 Tax=Xyrauchen texanus TaxID=154827 RepID=UPI0022419994|nr:uncharacterized protein LOC127621606 isoform X5 [Xyrauchen texanus]
MTRLKEPVILGCQLCVLKVIKDLDRKAEFLVVGEIPGFISLLSNAAEQNIDNITQSAATVSTIVEILFKVADLSQTISIDKPVMENFLKTVDIIVSDTAKGTWRDLNNGNTSGNTSIKLLQAIETYDPAAPLTRPTAVCVSFKPFNGRCHHHNPPSGPHPPRQ